MWGCATKVVHKKGSRDGGAQILHLRIVTSCKRLACRDLVQHEGHAFWRRSKHVVVQYLGMGKSAAAASGRKGEEVSEESPPEDSDPSPTDSGDLGSESCTATESEDDEDGEAFESVTVDFDFTQPSEEDFHGIKLLLTNWLDIQKEASALSDLIVARVRKPRARPGHGRRQVEWWMTWWFGCRCRLLPSAVVVSEWRLLLQGERTTLLTCGDDRDVIGMTALLPCPDALSVAPSIGTLLRSRCKDAATKAALATVRTSIVLLGVV